MAQTDDTHDEQPSSSRPQDHIARLPANGHVQEGQAVRFLAPPTGRTGSPMSDRARRRSSFAERIGTFGGANSLHNFARSWHRAASFRDIDSPRRRSFIFEEDLEEDEEDDDQQQRRESDARPRRDTTSLLRTAIAHDHRHHVKVHESPFEDDHEPEHSVGTNQNAFQRRRSRLGSAVAEDGIFEIESDPVSPGAESFHQSYGTVATPSLSRDISPQSPTRPSIARRITSLSSLASSDKEQEPLLVKRIESQDGAIVTIVVGKSTLPQTIFNAVNILVGVGMLSLPLAMRYSGWLFGGVFFLFAAWSTSYTSKLLAKCLDVDASLITFGDLAYVSFGRSARIGTSLIFTLELFAACVALVVLFADSLNALIPGWTLAEWKILCGIILIPLSVLPLHFLSFTSILGILTCCGIAIALFVDGLYKAHAPGSLREPMQTYLLPQNWKTLPLAFGLLMGMEILCLLIVKVIMLTVICTAPWGGQSVFPNIYRDMRHPKRYDRAVDLTWVFTFTLEASIAVAGYLMFGDGVLDEVTKNIFKSQGYPKWISMFIAVAIAIIPLTKIPLSARPIISTAEVFLGLHNPSGQIETQRERFRKNCIKFVVNVVTTIIFVIVAILVPSFDRIMSLLGSFACFTVCVILPCSFHLKIFGKELPLRTRITDWVLIIVCTILAIVGTVSSFLPKSLLEAKDPR